MNQEELDQRETPWESGMDPEPPLPSTERLIRQMETVIRGKRTQIEQVVTCLLAGGHILMEDNPGTGKTVLARSLAQSIAGNEDGNHLVFKRIQFTPDLLPMDLIGTYIFDDRTKDFHFRKGPLFCNILLADEINRASPKVQSALLESMAEHQITVGDQTFALERMFFTIATQNPVEMEGTYPLPVAQLDRFFMKIYFGYVDQEVEWDIYREYLSIAQNLKQMEQVLTMQEILSLQEQVRQVHVHEEILKTMTSIIRATREHGDIHLGASIRSGIAFLQCLRAQALIRGRDYVTEDDLAHLYRPVLDHRLVYRNRSARVQALDQIAEPRLEKLVRMRLFS